MAWAWWTGGTLLWLAAWLVLGARYTASKHDDAWVAAAGRLLAGFAVATCVGAFAAVPHRDSPLRAITLWAHHASFSALFLFLLAAHYCHAEAWWRARGGGSVRSAATAIRRLWVLTELVPAPIALVILLTGLRLMWESPDANSLERTWLSAMVLGFSVFFWDGIVGYRPLVRELHAEWARAGRGERPPIAAQPTVGGLGRNLQLLAHTISFPLVFLVGLARHDLPAVPTTYVAYLERRLAFLPGAWPGVALAVLAWAATGLVVLVVRAALGRRRPRAAPREVGP